MGTLIIVAVIAVVVIIGIRSTMKRATSGCCSTGDKEEVKKVKVEDRDISHYPYTAVLDVDGMMCSGCATKVDNALNSLKGVYAKTDLSKKKTTVHMKEKLEETTLRRTVNDIGPYTVMKVEMK